MSQPTDKLNSNPQTSLVPIQQQNYGFLQMPVEIAIEILKYVASQDIASCNLVCKQLHQIFNSDPTWGHLLNAHFSFRLTPKTNETHEKDYKRHYRCDSNLSNGRFRTRPYEPNERVSLAISNG